MSPSRYFVVMRVEDVDTALPQMGAAWSFANSIGLIEALQDHRPACADDLTPEIRTAMELAPGAYGAEAKMRLERRPVELNEEMAQIFDPARGVDFVITASNPDFTFDAAGPLPDTFGGIVAAAKINRRLTFPANLYGNPAISFPAGFLDRLPIDLQVISRHFDEELLLDLALTVERSRPWPLTVHDGTPS